MRVALDGVDPRTRERLVAERAVEELRRHRLNPVVPNSVIYAAALTGDLVAANCEIRRTIDDAQAEANCAKDFRRLPMNGWIVKRATVAHRRCLVGRSLVRRSLDLRHGARG
jgi:hypothetical protein